MPNTGTPGDGNDLIFPSRMERRVTPSNYPAYVYLQAACTNPNIHNVNSLSGPALSRVWEEFSRCRMWPTRAITRYRPPFGAAADLLRPASHIPIAIRLTTHRIEAIPILVNSYDLRENNASSNFDERHLVSVSYVYQLPLKNFPRNFIDMIEERAIRRMAAAAQGRPVARGSVNELLDGWELSGVRSFSRARPLP